MNNTKLLLTAVFKPYGIKNKYAEGLGMQMELMNNQVTRMQGVHSLREVASSYQLYLLAENISVPCVVLDFPSWNDFKRELKKGYTHIAISFILANFLKAKRMVDYIRDNYPDMKIILGGQAIMTPELKDQISYDFIAGRDGVRWLREFFGEEPNLPIVHPTFKTQSYGIYGLYKKSGRSAVIVSGLGCTNSCDFCSSSTFFLHQYIPILRTGEDVFNECKRLESEIGATGFFMMDENFIRDKQRAKDLLLLMTENKKVYGFDMFAAADVIVDLGVDFLVRLGLRMIWIGVESKKDIFNKTRNIDIKELIKSLQTKGISVLASGILFLDHHNEQTMQEDIDWMVDLNSDLAQFMNYFPPPTSPLNQRLENQGRMRSLPYRECHGHGELPYVHPNFKDPSKMKTYLIKAHLQKYHEGGPAILNMAITAINGYVNCKSDFEFREKNQMKWNPNTLRYEKSENWEHDKFMELRLAKIERRARSMRPFLLPAMIFAPNKKARIKAKQAMDYYNKIFGKANRSDRVKSIILVFTGIFESILLLISKLLRRESVIRQPPTMRKEYNF